jgi:FkbM family methyltransferase
MLKSNLFISYAQNFEDVLLWRALKNITNGFYIDVGANDPKIDSVTKAFYDAGWSGINIEPVDRFYKKLQNHRRRDLNLNCAVSSEVGQVTIYDVDVNGWATLDKSAADNFKLKGKTTKSYAVEARTLKDICRDCTRSQIHFLKIDVEGFELEVLKGADFTTYRPWIVVIESTKPDSQVEDYEKWEQIMIKSDYSFAFFDGLNRYYIASEHRELHSHFKCPPNCFDAFIISNHYEAEARIMSLISSQSWKITEPLRVLNDCLHIHKKRGIRFYYKQFLSCFESFVRRQPILNQLVLKLLDYFPILPKFFGLRSNNSYRAVNRVHSSSSELVDISPQARRIYADLKLAIDRTRGKVRI